MREDNKKSETNEKNEGESKIERKPSRGVFKTIEAQINLTLTRESEREFSRVMAFE